MYKKLVVFDQWHFTEIDPVRLKRRAQDLKDFIMAKIPTDDQYKVHTRLLPILELAIRGEIYKPFEKNSDLIDGKYLWDEREGLLPPEYEGEFSGRFSEFAVINAPKWPSRSEASQTQSIPSGYGCMLTYRSSFVSLEASIPRERLTSKGRLTARAHRHFGPRSRANCFSESHVAFRPTERINNMVLCALAATASPRGNFASRNVVATRHRRRSLTL